MRKECIVIWLIQAILNLLQLGVLLCTALQCA
jgi:hypothetical protein